MFRKKQSEFQYAPGIEKIIEDIQGGGTIARAELKGIIDELPPLVMVGKDANGLYHIVKTGRVTAVAAADAVAIQVAKNHVYNRRCFNWSFRCNLRNRQDRPGL
jgi:hypothetical protein